MSHATHRVEVLNTNYGRALNDQRTVDHLFGPNESGNRPDIVVLQEVWPDATSPVGRAKLAHSRSSAQMVMATAGYDAHFPDTSFDLVFALPRDSATPVTAEHPIETRALRALRSIAVRARQRMVGLHTLTMPLGEAWKLRVINSHRIPPPSQLFSKIEAKRTPDLLAEHYPQPGVDDPTLTLYVGDLNHWPGPGKDERRLVSELGYRALIPHGTPTCLVEKTHPSVGRVLRKLGVDNPQLDAAYLLAPKDFEIVDCGVVSPDTLTARQIGYSLVLHELASDHLGLGITLYSPRLSK